MTKIFAPIDSQNPIYLGAADDELFEEVLREHGGVTFAEIKEDGYRAQVHKRGNVAKAFTRQGNEILLNLYPELNSSIANLPDCILDCELIGEGRVGKNGFNIVKSRFRHRINESKVQEYLGSGIVEDMPLALRVFDTLRWEETDVLNLPFNQRRRYTEGILENKIVPSVGRTIDNSDELSEWFNSLTGEFYEGLVCKNPESVYLPGKRTSDWVKLKRSETLDLVVLGVYFSQDELSQILCGSYNSSTKQFETLAKVNAKRNGMNEELVPLLQGYLLESAPANVLINPVMYKQKRGPDFFVNPLCAPVVEVSAMNFHYSNNWHSCGLGKSGKSYSLRIGWLKDIRQDKGAVDATSTSQVKDFYESEGGENA